MGHLLLSQVEAGRVPLATAHPIRCPFRALRVDLRLDCLRFILKSELPKKSGNAFGARRCTESRESASSKSWNRSSSVHAAPYRREERRVGKNRVFT